MFVGDSETANGVSGSTGTKNCYLAEHGYMNHYLGLLGWPYLYVVGRNSTTNLPTGANAGVGGNTSTQLLARYDTDVISKFPDIVHILIGTNDIHGSAGTPSAATSAYNTLIANVTAMIDKNERAGIETRLHSILPRNNVDGGGGSDFTANERLLRVKCNTALKDMASRRGIIFYNHDTVLCNSAGDMITGYTSDGLHIIPIAAYWIAINMINSDGGMTPQKYASLYVDKRDIYDANYNEYGSVLTNGALSGTGGTAGTGITGSVADNVTVKRSSGSDVTAVCSKITKTVGGTTIDGQRFVVTTTGAGGANEFIRARFNSDTVAISTLAASGTWLGMGYLCRVGPSTGVHNLYAPYLQVQDQSASGSTIRGFWKPGGNGLSVDVERTMFLGVGANPIQLVGTGGYFVDFLIEVDATKANTFTVDLFAPVVKQLMSIPNI